MNLMTLYRRNLPLLLTFFLFVGIFASTPGTAHAHIPFIALDEHASRATALEVKDIHISKVIYQKLHSEAQQSWIKIDGAKGKTLDLDLGLPYLPELADYRPSLMLIPPSADGFLSDKNIRFDSVDQGTPEFFHEPFSDTRSWIIMRKSIQLTENGEYFLVSFSPENEPGKLWVAIGKEEAFGPRDLARLPTTMLGLRAFHQSDQQDKDSDRSVFSLTAISAVVAAVLIISLILLLKFKFFKRRSNRQ